MKLTMIQLILGITITQAKTNKQQKNNNFVLVSY